MRVNVRVSSNRQNTDRVISVGTHNSRTLTQLLDEIGGQVENIRAGWNISIQTERFDLLEQYLGSLSSLYRNRSWFKDGESLFKDSYMKL